MAVENMAPIVPIDSMNNLDPVRIGSPYTTLWWKWALITDVPESALPWLLAQGWKIVAIRQDESTTPPTPYYTMGKEGMNNWIILQHLMNQFTIAYNEGRRLNATRYNDIVRIWNEMIVKTTDHLDEMASDTNAAHTLYINSFSTLMDEIDDDIASVESTVVADSETIRTQLAAFLAKLADLEVNYAAHLSKIESVLDDMDDELTTHLAAYDAELDTLKGLFDTHESVVDAKVTTLSGYLDSHATSYLALLDKLAGDLSDHETAIETITNRSAATLASFKTVASGLISSLLTDWEAQDNEIRALLTTADGLLGTHATNYEALLALLLSDFSSHDVEARQYLIDLGATELARINEHFDNLLAKTRQELTNRGFYSSALVAQTDARVERERDEAIAALNDRLAREKLENAHQLYGQRTGMRDRVIAGRDRLHATRQEALRYHAESLVRLYGQLQDVRNRTLAARQALHAVEQDMDRYFAQVESDLYAKGQEVRRIVREGQERVFQLRSAFKQWDVGNEHQLWGELATVRQAFIDGATRQYAATVDANQNVATQRDRLYAHIQDAVKGVLAGRERYSQLTQQNAQFLTDSRYRLCTMKMQVAIERMKQLRETHTFEMELMKYQLEARNKWLVDLFGFMERRTDSYPDIDRIAQLVTGLADSGSTQWITP